MTRLSQSFLPRSPNPDTRLSVHMACGTPRRRRVPPALTRSSTLQLSQNTVVWGLLSLKASAASRSYSMAQRDSATPACVHVGDPHQCDKTDL